MRKKRASCFAPCGSVVSGQVPQDQWRSTPVRLMATAGLRRLDPETASSILAACTHELANSGFYTPGLPGAPGGPGSSTVHQSTEQVASIIPGTSHFSTVQYCMFFVTFPGTWQQQQSLRALSGTDNKKRFSSAALRRLLLLL